MFTHAIYYRPYCGSPAGAQYHSLGYSLQLNLHRIPQKLVAHSRSQSGPPPIHGRQTVALTLVAKRNIIETAISRIKRSKQFMVFAMCSQQSKYICIRELYRHSYDSENCLKLPIVFILFYINRYIFQSEELFLVRCAWPGIQLCIKTDRKHFVLLSIYRPILHYFVFLPIAHSIVCDTKYKTCLEFLYTNKNHHDSTSALN